jgi:hypothetical protein
MGHTRAESGVPGTGIVGKTVAESEQGLRSLGFGIWGGNYGQCEKLCKIFALALFPSKSVRGRVMRIISVKFRVYFHRKCGTSSTQLIYSV